ncbi:GPI-anchored protein LLG1 [Lactuca sativa]|uniref:GPI-anchored protein LLG1 n=1 Tax=Lactuca sativa TaxID=4236 RepID=UPI001C693CBF|nr:GPI-anchored protein LLG1 [Lactuca sativa]
MCDVVENGLSESFNSVIKDARKKPIITMLEEIRLYVMERIYILKIKDNTHQYYKVTGRNLLQQKQSCPVNFENENYTIITSQCKGPVYQREPCCNSFLQIACPHWEQINDEKTNCASTLFSYINVYGKYPPGLFASMCKGDKKGLSCEKIDTSTSKKGDKSQAATMCIKSPWVMIMGGVMVFVLEFFG